MATNEPLNRSCHSPFKDTSPMRQLMQKQNFNLNSGKVRDIIAQTQNTMDKLRRDVQDKDKVIEEKN